MNTDKVLALAREAGFYVRDDGEQAYSADSYDGICTPELVRFAALLQREMEAELRKDAERLDWLEADDGRFHNIDRITSVVGSGFNQCKTLREAIDSARNK